jgi:hypothetical protein
MAALGIAGAYAEELGGAKTAALEGDLYAAKISGQVSREFGGCSFSAGTRVLLASGKAAPISGLKQGDKVLATSTATGKTTPETVTAVEVSHDTNLYDLRIKTAHGVAVIHTTASHLFWDPYLNQWRPAAKLKPGEHLLTANGTVATADGGTIPKVHEGWMWDLTVPGNNDHDFYAIADQGTGVPVLVHNNGGGLCDISELKGDEPGTAQRLMASPEYNGGQLHGFTDTNNPDFVDSNGRTYDAVGGPTAWRSPKLNMGRMLNSIQSHMYFKSGFDYTVLDLTGASSGQIDQVFSAIDSWGADPNMTAQNQLIILGDGY